MRTCPGYEIVRHKPLEVVYCRGDLVEWNDGWLVCTRCFRYIKPVFPDLWEKGRCEVEEKKIVRTVEEIEALRKQAQEEMEQSFNPNAIPAFQSGLVALCDCLQKSFQYRLPLGKADPVCNFCGAPYYIRYGAYREEERLAWKGVICKDCHDAIGSAFFTQLLPPAHLVADSRIQEWIRLHPHMPDLKLMEA